MLATSNYYLLLAFAHLPLFFALFIGLVRIFDVRSRTVAAKIAPPPSPIAPHQILTAVDASQTVQPLVRNPSLPPLQPVLSLLTHTGQRPRKVRRIVPDPNRPAVFATFSDVAGDAVKVLSSGRPSSNIFQ